MQAALNLTYVQAGLLGSANTVGYLAGALLSHTLLYRVGYRRGFYGALLLQVPILLCCALTSNFELLLTLRLLQGGCGAVVFVGGAALLLASGARALGTGLYFGGVGLGILASPVALAYASSWQHAWALLALLSLLLSAVAFLPYRALGRPAPQASRNESSLRPIVWLLVAYGLYGAGYIGYMTFVTSGLGVALGPFWLVLGLGACLTGLIWGPWLTRMGGDVGIFHILLVLALASTLPIVVALPWVSAFAFGISFLGVITALTDVFRALLPPGAWARAMGASTAVFALGQAVGPSLSGLAGDLAGGVAGALWLSTGLLVLALVAALLHRQVSA